MVKSESGSSNLGNQIIIARTLKSDVTWCPFSVIFACLQCTWKEVAGLYGGLLKNSQISKKNINCILALYTKYAD